MLLEQPTALIFDDCNNLEAPSRPSNDSCREPVDTESTERAKHAHLPVIYSFKGHPSEDGFFFVVPLGNISTMPLAASVASTSIRTRRAYGLGIKALRLVARHAQPRCQ
jgi:hypothetical protein